jgi:adenylate cyclase
MNSASGVASFFVADWLVEPKSNSLIRDEESTHVEPKAMRVLTMLAANAGQVVTRQELEDSIWADMVVGPDSLTNTVIKLRRALKDNARNASIIETIPKTGYRLIAPVREIEEEGNEPPLERRLSAILYADVAGYSRLTGENEERTHRILSANLDLFAGRIRSHNGTVVHYAGDAILAEFTTVTSALSCAVEVQRELRDSDDAQSDSHSVQFRIGINLGEVIVDRDDIYGDGVNIAARLEGLADVGSICISESVYSAIGNKLPLDYEFMGEQTVKNIAEPVRAYRVLFFPSAQKAKRVTNPRFKTLAIVAVLVAAISGLVAMWSLFSTIALESKPSIAVLPFANVNVDASEDYLAEGMTRDLITDLTKISSVDVIAYTSVENLINQALNIEEIGEELGVQYIVEGSIRRAGERVRINVQLVETETKRHLWAERYDRGFDEFFDLQDELIAHVVEKIAVTTTPSEAAQIERLPTNSLEAYHNYLLGQQAGYISSGAGWHEIKKYYDRAIELDPDFAEAHSALARLAVYAWRTDINDVISGAMARNLAFESASSALEIDPANAQSYSVLAVLQLADHQHTDAIVSARKAVQLAPGSAEAHLDLGLVLVYSGELKEAVDEVETALRLDPGSPDTLLYAGIVFFFDGQYQRAVDVLSRARLERQDSEQVWTFLLAAYGLQEQKIEAAEALTGLLNLYPNMNLEYFRARENYFRRPEDLEHLLRGLDQAGLPEWPFDFRGVESDLLDAEELRQVVENKTWVGKHLNGVEFFQQVTSSGSLAYRSENSFQTGRAKFEGNRFCQQFDDDILNNFTCGYVYRNPKGSAETHDDFVVVMPGTLRYFSLSP